jgi:hypothetical protein
MIADMHVIAKMQSVFPVRIFFFYFTVVNIILIAAV